MAQIIRKSEIFSKELVRFSAEQLAPFPQKRGVTILSVKQRSDLTAREAVGTQHGQQPSVGAEHGCAGSAPKQSKLRRAAPIIAGYLQQACCCLLAFASLFSLFQITQLPSADNIYLFEVNPLVRKLQFLRTLKFPVNKRLRSQPTFLLLLDRN